VKVALGQFAVAPAWQSNLATCRDFYARAATAGADLLVLPEGIIARDAADPDYALKIAQPLDGPFVSGLAEITRGSGTAVRMTVQVPTGTGKVFNTFVALRDGAVVAAYRKLHLYDAFAARESRNVTPGDEVPPLVEIAGFRLGLMTCYDVRFPELARRLAVDGADVLVMPAAWVKGPMKERHWDLLVAARALENTCWMVAVGECGERNIGQSMVVDPLGVVTVRVGEAPALAFAGIDRARLDHARAALPVLANRRFARPELAGPPA
jgi:predicted amidohydrolase